MTRGDFLTIVMKLYGLSGWEVETTPFSDVPEDSVYYDTVMAARSAGIVYGSGSNNFLPDIYVSGTEAQAIISRTLDYIGQENQLFGFSEGDFSYMLTPYTTRADIAKALYSLLTKMSTPTVSLAKIFLNEEPLDWPTLTIGNSNYVALEAMQQTFPTLRTASDSQERALSKDAEYRAENGPTCGVGEIVDQRLLDTEGADTLLEGKTTHLPIPMYDTNRIFLSTSRLYNGSVFADVPSFTYQGVQYVMLRRTMNLLNVDVQWDGESKAIKLLFLE